MPSTPLKMGTTAPDFTLPRNGGGEISLSSLYPQKVILYFYPKDDTPGCTLEAQDFSTLVDDFYAIKAIVIGISKDSITAHDKFCAKHNFSVILASDEKQDICERYGVWVEKNMYGRKYMGIERTTFLINGEGNIIHVWKKVKAKGHANEVLEAVKAL